ncbi:MAG: glycine cleavage system protein GcvH [Pseudomonadota bacterium]
MSTLYYTEDHEYIRVDGEVGTVGISEYAQSQLGDVVYVELPEPGTQFDQTDETGVIESVKVASEIYAPVSGEIIETNEALESNAGLVNDDPMGDGWIYKIKIIDDAELVGLKDEDDYEEFIQKLS